MAVPPRGGIFFHEKIMIRLYQKFTGQGHFFFSPKRYSVPSRRRWMLERCM